MSLSPIVLFVYNRPEHTKNTIKALQDNKLASGSELFIYSDASKDESSIKKVNEVRKLIENISGFKSVTVIKQITNQGLASSIINGVTEIVNKYGKIIVLEDDLVTSPLFLTFMNDALDYYQNEEKVWHISGYTPPIEIGHIDTHFFIKPTSCWGWATWKGKWFYYKKDAAYYLEKFTTPQIKSFNMDNSMDYHSHIILNNNKKINTWAIFWYATVFFQNGLSLHPYRSYVQNIGHDNSGVHCSENSNFDIDLNSSLHSFPCNIVENKFAYNAFVNFYKKCNPSIFKRTLRKIKRIIKK